LHNPNGFSGNFLSLFEAYWKIFSKIRITRSFIGKFLLSYTKKINLPGVVLRFVQGPGPIEGDNPLSGELFVSQMERALLENMEVSRQPGPESKTLTLPEIEERLENVIRIKGEAGLNEVRDKAWEIAQN
jgi:hypothetical protein